MGFAFPRMSSPFTSAMRMDSRAMSCRLLSSFMMRSSKRNAMMLQSGQMKTAE